MAAVEPVPNLAQRLKSERESRGISQSQAARELEVARTAYRLWELEAARPAPDRWRLVARWLGVSMTTLLLAEGLMTADEGVASDVADARFLVATGQTADLATEAEAGGFFDQAETYVDKGLERGLLTAEEAKHFRATFRRIQAGLSDEDRRHT